MSVTWNIVARWALGAVALPALIAAAPAQNGFLKQPMMAEATIGSGPQIQASNGRLDGFTAAPMPDLDRDTPVVQPVEPNAPRVSPKLFHKKTTYHGEGYLFGSTVQEEQDRRVRPAPGINLIMPLQ